ncbi:hypothetical protein KAU33_05550 [Candidatus Dependentiae bacterium]|nr:hypothetical protein [Candidatus Dependentiae bacterium]
MENNKKSILFNYLIFLFITLMFFLGSCSKNIEKYIKEEHDAPQILEEIEIKSLPHLLQLYSTWPSDKKIKRKKVSPSKKNNVKEAIDETILWINKILKENYIPDDLEKRMILLKSDVNGCDSIRIRYEVENYKIQIFTTSAGINFIIKPIKINKSLNLSQEDKIKFAEETIKEFFNESDKIIVNSNYTENSSGDFIETSPSFKDKESSYYWWGLVSWFTNGNVLLIGFGKAERFESVEKPILKKNWF